MPLRPTLARTVLNKSGIAICEGMVSTTRRFSPLIAIYLDYSNKVLITKLVIQDGLSLSWNFIIELFRHIFHNVTLVTSLGKLIQMTARQPQKYWNVLTTPHITYAINTQTKIPTTHC